MSGFVASAGGALCDPVLFGGRPSEAYRDGDVHVRATPPSERGMTSFVATARDGLFVGHGDRTPLSGAVPAGDGALETIDWCRRSLARFCAVVLRPPEIVLAVDALAACPLFFAVTESGRLVVATEVKAVLFELAAECVSAAHVDAPAACRTAFNGVHAVPAGSRVVLSRDSPDAWNVAVEPYFAVPDARDCEPADAARAILDALRSEAHRAVAGETSVGIMLSGGVDSSAVTALVRECFDGPLCTFTVGTPFGDEHRFAREVAVQFHTEHHELTLNARELASMLPRLIWAAETWDPEILKILAPMAFLYREVSGYVSTLVTGYGADLIYAGTLETTTPPADAESMIRANVAAATRSNELSPTLAHACGITVRHPYWTERHLSAGMRVPAELKLASGVEKAIMRDAVSPFVAPATAWRPKSGIHEGTAMHLLFADVFGTAAPDAQRERLRDMAASMFGPAVAARNGEACASC